MRRRAFARVWFSKTRPEVAFHRGCREALTRGAGDAAESRCQRHLALLLSAYADTDFEGYADALRLNQGLGIIRQ